MAGTGVSTPLLVIFSLSTVSFLHFAVSQKIPAIFIFGDSTADVGTNNFIDSKAKADHPYYGMDFPNSKPTGRFSNGYNTADFLSILFGFKRSPCPFLALLNDTKLFKRHIQYGVNFASGGSGILNSTGKLVVSICFFTHLLKETGTAVHLSEQLQQYVTVHQNLTVMLGEKATASILCNSLFFISAGSNDIFEYYKTNKTSGMPKFITSLISTYEDQLKTLFNNGARKFGIASVPPIGCCPKLRAKNDTGGCLNDVDVYSRMFFTKLKAMLIKLQDEYGGTMKYSLGNTYEMVSLIITNPLLYGFKNVTGACCKEKFCLPSGSVCPNRDEYLFWDQFHPTQKAAELGALTLYGASQTFVTPVNFSRLFLND
ncbi:hypothetical protein GIB67_007058 [Kingdonia uniflora]|uniref:GDSL esterase/lipase n=1 Tax=Kingdonia uniflora TaxID=39325 RepID=A0A7J7NZC8_9MAGN|nr:hypothetical protein GIB67_007058 [Kingdonia uniflora]